MKTWLKFLLIPIITMWVLELVVALIVGGVFGYASDTFLGLTSSFIIYFFGGVVVYMLAPESNKIMYSMIFSVIYIGIGLYFGIITDGNVVDLMGERVVQEFFIFPEIVKAAGILIAVYGAHQNENDESNKETA
ncbi:hypothetical protein [Moritella sp. Urea-trap-13]|uniref:hypothetical protein n=1 Tax=Moritella sp. Urea-trap-13 TaxID=2058327 RepID=UPI000C31C9D2|nr:hypothetical protein [Moritella sp. Urea-trap-13]PKH06414.1 hypothetical protein CXF93_10895 [Moritella sp. Urea-trap-13]